jgi:hypothetical protein
VKRNRNDRYGIVPPILIPSSSLAVGFYRQLFYLKIVGILQERQNRDFFEDRVKFKRGFTQPEENDLCNHQSLELALVPAVDLGRVQKQPRKTKRVVLTASAGSNSEMTAFITSCFAGEGSAASAEEESFLKPAKATRPIKQSSRIGKRPLRINNL